MMTKSDHRTVRQLPQVVNRYLAKLAVFILGTVALPSAMGQTFPSKPVTIISSSAATGDFDATLRLAAQAVSERTGKIFIVQPTPGGLGILAPQSMLRAEPDGHTIGSIFSSNITVAPLTMKDRPFNTPNDFAAITMVLKNGVALMTQASMPINSVSDLVKLAKSRPGQMRVGYAGIGSKLMILQFEKMTGTQFLQVPYKSGAEMMASLLNSDLELHLDLAPSALPMIRAGRAKALSIGTLTRTSLLPNLPSISETVPGLEMQSWLGLIAPARVPQDRIEWLNREFVAALNSSALKDKIVSSGYEFVANSTRQFTQALRNEVLENEKLVKEFNLTLN